MNSIKTKVGVFNFEPIHLYNGRKRINKEISAQNLLIIREILKDTNLRWGLVFGTLLGAIREGDFIDHDEDTDIYVLEEDRDEMLCLIPDFLRSGFNIARCGDTLFSIIRENEYIDIYFFTKKMSKRQSGMYVIPGHLLASTSYIQFLGVDFPTVNDPISYLEFTYGSDWRVPKVNSHAQGTAVTFKGIIKKILPKFVLMNFKKWSSK